MPGDITAAPTANATAIKTMLFTQPPPRDALPNINLQYLSASLMSDCLEASVPLANAFSFCK